MFYIDLCFSASAGSENTEGIMEFMRFVTLDSSQLMQESFYSATQTAFDSLVSDALMNGISYYGMSYTIDEADAQKLLALIDATQTVAYADPTLCEILSEEAAAYFAGTQTAEKTAEVIQSRASIYLAE